MKTLQRMQVVMAVLAVGLIWQAHGQSLRTISSQRIQITSQPLEASSVPFSGNFYLLSQSGQTLPPLPLNPYAALGLSVYALGSNTFLIDDSSLDNASRAMSAGRMSANDVSGPPGFGDFGGGDYSSGSSFVAPDYGTNLWMAIALTDGGVTVTLSNTLAGEIYELMSRESLSSGSWQPEQSLHALTNEITTMVPTQARTNSLFLWARDWTGFDENANGLPDWWEWEYFGGFVNAGGDYDGDGVNNGMEYTNGTDPNKIVFTVAVTNQFVNTSLPPV